MAKCFVSAYAIERCYGGAEEGGWWFDNWQPIKTVKVSNRTRLIKKYVKILEQQYKNQKNIEVMYEKKYREYATKYNSYS